MANADAVFEQDQAEQDMQEGPDYLASLKLIWPYLKGEKAKLYLAIGLATLAVVLELVPVYLIYVLIGHVLEGTLSAPDVLLFTGLALVSVVASHLLQGAAMMVSHLVAYSGIFHLRMAISRHLARLPLGYFGTRKSGDAKKLVIDDPEKLELIVAHGVPDGISSVASWVAVSVWLFVIDWRLALAAIFIAPVSFALLFLGMKSATRFAGAYQAAGERMNGATVEYIAGMPVVKVFNRVGESFKEASDAVARYADIEKRWAGAYLPLGGSFYSLVLSNVVFIVPAGALALAYGSVNIATLVFFVILGANYSRPLLKLFNLFHELAHISMGSMLVAEILNLPQQKDTGDHIALCNHDVSFENVHFGYGQHDVLHDISFVARQGSVTALVGPSGSGKSTIASLVPRFFDVRSGRICIGGVDVRDMALDQLMDTIAFVFQDTFLFTDTIAGNIRFGKPDASDAEVADAARAARAHDFIMALPEGYQTKLGDLGRNLSGGERQRIAIARAILKNAPIIVLDEATAFADPDNEAAIQDAIEALAAGRTLIVVAHRLHTISEAELIIAVEHGHIREQGQHDQLIAAGGLYARLWSDFIATRSSSLRDTTITNAKA